MLEKEMSYEELKQVLLKSSDSYYNKGFSEISDDEYDILFDEFCSKYSSDPFINTIGSPIPENSPWPTAPHKIPMYSCNKVNTTDELDDWVRKNDAVNEYYITSLKLDGFSLEVEYENGILTSGITRGTDGIEGEVITPNVLRMQNIVKELSFPYTGSIRGEAMMTIKNFKELNKIREQRGEELFQNPRNAAAGIARGRDGRYVEYLHVQFYFASGVPFISKQQMFDYIEIDLELVACKHYYGNLDTAKLVYAEYAAEKRSLLPFEIDGLVIELNDLPLQEKLGLTRDNLRGQIAFKFESAKARTHILGGVWQLGKTKRMTPVALLEPTPLAGVIISRASIHNIAIFKTFNFHEGDTVLIARNGDVIPQVIKNLSDIVGHERGSKIEIPTKCPACSSVLVEDGTYLMCVNPDCAGGKIGDLQKWIKTMDLKGVADATVENLYLEGLIKEPADFYRLHEDQISCLEGFGESSANKIVTTIQSKKNITFPELLGGLNIPNIGRRIGKTLQEAGYDNYKNIIGLDPTTIAEIHSLGIETGGQIIEGLKKKVKVIENLFEVGITIKEKVIMTESGHPLTGKAVVFTGALNLKRAEAQQIVMEKGGTCPSSISKNVDILVIADPTSTSGKADKARKLGIQMVDESQFMEMVG